MKDECIEAETKKEGEDDDGNGQVHTDTAKVDPESCKEKKPEPKEEEEEEEEEGKNRPERRREPIERQQQQSPLLCKLSPELRLVIWENVLGGSRLHIIQRTRRRLGYIVCPETGSCEICRGGLPQPVRDGGRSLALAWTESDGPSRESSSTGGELGLLSLALTCRQM